MEVWHYLTVKHLLALLRITKRNKIRRAEKKVNGQKYTFYNIEILYKTGKSVTKLFHNYFLMVVIDKSQTEISKYQIFNFQK